MVERVDRPTIEYIETLKTIREKSGPAAREVVDEFLQKFSDGKIKIIFSAIVPTSRVAERQGNEAVVFIPAAHSVNQMRQEAASLLIDTLAITRGLDALQLKEMDGLEKRLREELNENA